MGDIQHTSQVLIMSMIIFLREGHQKEIYRGPIKHAKVLSIASIINGFLMPKVWFKTFHPDEFVPCLTSLGVSSGGGGVVPQWNQGRTEGPIRWYKYFRRQFTRADNKWVDYGRWPLCMSVPMSLREKIHP